MYRFLFVATTLAALCCPSHALHAQSKTWTGAINDSWQTGGNWNPVGAPGVFDAVLVSGSSANATLAADSTIVDLDIENGADVHTNGQLLHVAGIAFPVSLPGETTVTGSELYVEGLGAGTGDRVFDTDELHVNLGGVVRMSGNADIDTSLLVGSGTVSGHGRIRLNANNGIGLSNSGFITAHIGELQVESVGGAPVDLDGLGDTGRLAVRTSGHLWIDGDLTDSFSSTIDLGHTATNNQSELTMVQDWALDANGVINIDNPSGSSGLGKINGGKLTTTGTVNVNSGFGTFTVDMDANSGAMFNVTPGATLVLQGRTIFESGSQVDISSSGKLSLSSSSTSTIFEPGSVLSMQSAELSIGGPVFMNQSTLDLDDAASTKIGPGGALSLHQIDPDDNVFNSDIELSGALSVNTITPWTIGSNGLLKLEGDGRVTGSPLEVQNGGEISVGTQTPTDNRIFAPLTIDEGSQITMASSGAKLTLSGATTLNGGGVFRQGSTTETVLVQEADLDITGTSTIAVNRYDWDGPLNNTQTTIHPDGWLVIASDQINLIGDIFHGDVLINGGTLHINNQADSWIARDGMIKLDNSSGTAQVIGEPLTNDGLITGDGTFHVHVTNDDTVAPGQSAGSLRFDDGFDQSPTGILEIEIGGPTGADHDRITVADANANLGGTLDVSLINGYEPALGTNFTIIVATGSSNVVGEFDTEFLPVFDNRTFSVSYNPGRVLLQVINAPLLGDFDGDGDVDGSDFLEWQRSDGTADGLADWQANYGAPTSLAASAAVPEPASCSITIINLLLLALYSRKQLL